MVVNKTPFQLEKKLKTTHGKIKQSLKPNKEEILIARSLQDFLNWVVYRKGLPKDFNSLEGLLTESLAEELRKDFRIMNLAKETFNSNQAGEVGEQGFAQAIVKIVNSVSNQLPSKISEDLREVIIGNRSATILSQKIQNEYAQQIGDKKTSANKYTQFSARQGKIDIDMTQIELTESLNSYAKKLMEITATVKNYTDVTIDLEDLNREKA